ncbi:MAG: signal recognition particle-docking protein FtsY [Candidatus Alcyoniella australis]|nr:signal recognition particle-docking protein FtsY [Candidatus Alcyoniella australis]
MSATDQAAAQQQAQAQNIVEHGESAVALEQPTPPDAAAMDALPLGQSTAEVALGIEHATDLLFFSRYGSAAFGKMLDPSIELPALAVSPQQEVAEQVLVEQTPIPAPAAAPMEAPWWAQLIVPGALVVMIVLMALVLKLMHRGKAKPEKLAQVKPDRAKGKAKKPSAQVSESLEEADEFEQAADDVLPEPEFEPEAEWETEPEPEPEPEPMLTREGLFTRLKSGLSKTRGGLVGRIDRLLRRGKIDAELFDELEEVLITADIGVQTAYRLLEHVQAQVDSGELADVDALRQALKDEIARIVSFSVQPVAWDSQHPLVLMIVGVNGVGKTTTIGKIAAQLTGQGKHVLLAAADTFRAAAIEQLEIWAQRANCDLIKQAHGADPGAVAFDAVAAAQARNADVVIVDTAGRLHTKTNLMEELKKIRRVVDKALPGAPHEVWLVLDANTGQNAINQAKMFNEMLDLSGLVLTKLDGTAKGGVIVGISNELQIPIRYIGIGEQMYDLRAFDPQQFVEALFAE